MGKALCIISDSDSLKNLCASIDSKKQALDQRLTFIKKQEDAAKEQFKNEISEDWKELEKILSEKGKLPEDYFDREDFYALTINLKKDIVELMTQEDDVEEGMPLPIRMLLESMRNHITPPPEKN